MEQLIISGRKSSVKKYRNASENDNDCGFVMDPKTQISSWVMESNFNIKSPRFIVNQHVEHFNPSKPLESLSDIIKGIDTTMVKTGYISRCVVLMYRFEGSVFIAKAGGGIHMFAIDSDRFSFDEASIKFYNMLNRSEAAERDFFIGSGSAQPLTVECNDDTKVFLMTQSMLADIEIGYGDSILNILDEHFDSKVNGIKVKMFFDNIYEFVYLDKSSSQIPAYLAMV